MTKERSLHSILSRLATISVVLAVGCGPRGESHTVDQVWSDAREGYNDVAASAAPDVAEPLKRVSSNLERLAGTGAGGDSRAISKEIAQELDGLMYKTGFTTRPALTELINQYRTISVSEDKPVALGAPALKLLAARTYTLLKTEVVTTKFKL